MTVRLPARFSEAAGQQGDEDHRAGLGQQTHTGAEHADAEPGLQELGHQEHRAQHDGGMTGGGAVRGAERLTETT
jgi:hypothetical protein